jgi:hypothetical protein
MRTQECSTSSTLEVWAIGRKNNFSQNAKNIEPRVMDVPSERFHTHCYLPNYRKWATCIRKHPFRFFRSLKITVWIFIRNSMGNLLKTPRKYHTCS